MFKKECRVLLSGFFSVIITTVAMAQNRTWQMQPLSIQTRWTAKVSPTNALSEYPRPQMVRNNWKPLNGLWNYAVADTSAGMPSKYQGTILVPYPIESSLSGVKRILQPSEHLWYQRTFEANPRKGNHVLLHFGAVDWKATVYVNGEKVGTHTGGYTAFTCDITDVLRSGNNDLVVKVYDPTDKGIGPHGKQTLNPQNIYYTPSSGIWQTVWLEEVPPIFIKSLKIIPDIDNQKVEVGVAIGAESSRVLSGDLKKRTDLSAFTIEVITKIGSSIISEQKYLLDSPIVFPIKNARLWSPDNPFLYDIEIKLMEDDKVVDQVKSYFGMRKVSIQKDENGVNRIFLNNKYTYNLGILDQGFWPDGLYTAPTDEALAFDIEAAKAMGFNTIRKHIKIEPARWYYHADKIGMLVWQDFVNPNQVLPNGAKQAFEEQIKETIEELYNFPCITTWVIFNEKWGQYDQQRITEWVKSLDNTRLINGHSGELLYINNELRSPSPNAFISADMSDVHSYPFPRNAPALPGKVRVLGEFGGIGVPVEGHLWDDLVAGWGYDGVVTPAVLKAQFAQMADSLSILERQGLSGSIYTQPFDVESEQNGLMTYDRAIIKFPIDSIRAFNAHIWPATRNYIDCTRAFTAQLLDSVSENYASRLHEYEVGRRDSFFLRNLAIMTAARKDSNKLSKITGEYIKQIKNPFAERNLRFILRFTHSTDGPGFGFLSRYTDTINSILGPNVGEMALMRIIYNEEIAPYDEKDNPDWDAIERRVIDKYGELGAERVWGNRMAYYASVQDWSNFEKYYKLYFDRAIPFKRSFININSVSWRVFEHCTDVRVLQTAVAATTFSLEKRSDDPNLIDTHANLLYKLGRKEEAIQWEQKAIDHSNEQKLYIETLNKMQKNLPTWQ